MTNQARRPIGLSPQSGDNMILGAGIAFHDIDLGDLKNGDSAEKALAVIDQWTTDKKGIGATNGDPVLTIGRGATRITTNDLHTDVKGMFDSRGEGSVTLAFTIQELADDSSWQRMLATTFIDPEDGSLRIGTVLRSEHYKDIAYVNMANNGDLMLFVLLNAIPTEDTVVTFSNTIGTPAQAPATFTATLGSLEEMKQGALPIKKFRFPFANTGGGTDGGTQSLASAFASNLEEDDEI